MRIAPEGYPYVMGSGIIAVVGYFAVGSWLALPLGVLTLFMLYFFRDPQRIIPAGEGLIVSPADGKVIKVRRVREECFIGGETIEISIFMSPLDVHVNRAPCDGRVTGVVHTPGRFLSAFKDEASVQNDNIAMSLDTPHGSVLVRQVAGFLARRAVCRARPRDTLSRGQRFGIIKFSSRVDLYLPPSVTVKVRPGDRVRAGESVLASMA